MGPLSSLSDSYFDLPLEITFRLGSKPEGMVIPRETDWSLWVVTRQKDLDIAWISTCRAAVRRFAHLGNYTKRMIVRSTQFSFV